jgi:hypothetical protein
MLKAAAKLERVPSDVVNPAPITRLVKLQQLENASDPIFVTLSGMLMLVNEENPAKAWLPMLVTGIPSIVIGIVTGALPRRM